MARRKLTEHELAAAVETLGGWELRDGKLHRLYKFDSFAEAIAWMVAAAIYADKIDHHPDWSNVYNRVEVELMTHDLGAISTLDLELAERMDQLFSAS